ncbi:MAG: potassium transporter TrkG [Endomicrobiia bacterium]|nr:potassium transporter TrkG [Endomicrobiia bacterium]
MSPARKILLFFAASIAAGGVILATPFVRNVPCELSSAAAVPAGGALLSGIFTAASAVCVTGLSVVNINEYFNLGGQLVILLLIQLGALGYVTFATASGMILGKLQVRDRMAIKEVVDPYTFEGLLTLLKRIIKMAFAIELIGAAILSVLFLRYFPPMKAVYYGFFHAVSAFANAGFSLFPTSFEFFSRDYGIMAVIAALILSGGIGFLVLFELFDFRRKKGLTLHAKMALIVSVALLVAGLAAALLFEGSNPASLGGRGVFEKVANAAFLSVTSRTAGFNTVRTAALSGTTLFFVMMLMFVGASPGGTGGGIKTTTFGSAILWAFAFIRGKEDVNIFNRKIPHEIVRKSGAYVMLGIAALVISYLTFSFVEPALEPLQGMFEIVSAFGTVGLSAGITPQLGAAARVILILTMITGRIGPLTLAMSAVTRQEKDLIEYPEERVVIG